MYDDRAEEPIFGPHCPEDLDRNSPALPCRFHGPLDGDEFRRATDDTLSDRWGKGGQET